MFLWINITLLVIVFFLFAVLYVIWPPDSPWSPWWRTNEKIARAMCKLAKVSEKDTVYDLGCGDGVALTIASKEYGAKGVGIEIDLSRYLFSKFRIRRNGLEEKVKILKENFNNVNLSPATIIFVYLVPKALEKLKSKFLKELKKGTLIVSYRYKTNLHLVAHDKVNNIYLYKI